MERGEKNFNFIADNLASGVYMVILRIKEKKVGYVTNMQKKILLLK